MYSAPVNWNILKSTFEALKNNPCHLWPSFLLSSKTTSIFFCHFTKMSPSFSLCLSLSPPPLLFSFVIKYIFLDRMNQSRESHMVGIHSQKKLVNLIATRKLLEIDKKLIRKTFFATLRVFLLAIGIHSLPSYLKFSSLKILLLFYYCQDRTDV